ncbi:FAD/NAD(P)-binding protein [Legionella spiritensis]|uniref:Hydrogenase/sulfur reductase subunit gamma n=1 Tax=Legionella spiritensis TaxID=452 RepID=A0A0W0YY12_LEGSP|nr:FAD/NAD(P)-binding protein [Legionella spiritensis]KTD61764.1 hydrogenase/sulfur reductase subunit gamma [Legionella spiritensis]SNV38555.1 hydrogenase/sulfur reductase gamma subunit [Legionella spiritensis]VEG90224.1 hydrogenase/sulfur reductase gamma subunit [Legionella spiritensis]
MINANTDPCLPYPIEIIARTQESPTIFSLEARFTESKHHEYFSFHPGQFNMLYLYGVGEVAISISSDPDEKTYLRHTIRAVGRVTKALQTIKKGDQLGLRGPFGQGWPVHQAQGKDVVIVTGGLGCAPTVSVINYILARRQKYGTLTLLQGVKHSEDFIFRKQYALWQQSPDTHVHIAADQAGPRWPWGIGYVTDMIQSITIDSSKTIAMLCGPEMMMYAAVKALVQKGMAEDNIYLSMERNMACGLGHCGHCQYGGLFVCKDGPVFAYPKIKALFSEKGF